jgi:DNA-binding NarL/FixJ family response regulator
MLGDTTMPYRLIIVPGENAVLRSLPEHLAEDVETMVLDSANDALLEVRSAPPEAIVADVDLPGMSGFDLAEILPNFGVTTKVVLWSRAESADLAQQASSAGVHRFLSGDIPADELRETLYDVLRSGAPEPAAPEAAPAPEPEPAPEPAPEAAPAPEPVAAPVPEPVAAAPARVSVPAREPSRPARIPPREAAAPEEHARKATGRRKDGPLVLTAENLAPIRRRLSDLAQDLGSDGILLTDRSGMPLVEVGSSTGLPMMVLGPLLSTSFSTAGELSRQLREEEATTLYMHEGTRYDLYCFDINQRFLMVIVFDKNTSPTRTKIGSVWVYAKRAIRDLQELLG